MNIEKSKLLQTFTIVLVTTTTNNNNNDPAELKLYCPNNYIQCIYLYVKILVLINFLKT